MNNPGQDPRLQLDALCGDTMVQLTANKIAVSVQYPPLARWMSDPLSPSEALFILFVIREKKCSNLQGLCGPILAFPGDRRASGRRLLPWSEFSAKLLSLCPPQGPSCVDVNPDDPSSSSAAAEQYSEWLRTQIETYPDSANLIQSSGSPLVALDSCIAQDFAMGPHYGASGCAKELGSALGLPMLMQYGLGGFARAYIGTDERTPFQAWAYCFTHQPVECTPPKVATQTTGIINGIMNGGFLGQFAADAVGAIGIFAPEVDAVVLPLTIAAGAIAGGVSSGIAAKQVARGMCQEDGQQPLTTSGGCVVQ